MWPRDRYTGPGGGAYTGPGGGAYTGPSEEPFRRNWPPILVLVQHIEGLGDGAAGSAVLA